MDIFISQEAQKAQWQAFLSILNDADLIEKVNCEVGNPGWTSSRGVYLQCLSNELRKRSFNSAILFEFNTNGTVAAFRLKNKVQLLNHKLEFKK